MTDFTGDSGDNAFSGTTGDDNFYVGQGGHDTIKARGGDDSIIFDASYGPGDVVDGGDGYDRVLLQGDYSAGVTAHFTNVEKLLLSSGGYNYDITVAAECFANPNGFTFAANALQTDDSFRADLTADGKGQTVTINDNAADFTIIGGAANETFIYESTSTATGSFSGGAGRDTVDLDTSDLGALTLNGGKGFDVLDLRVAGTFDFTSGMLTQFERITLSGGAAHLTLADGNVARGHSLTIDGGGLSSGQALVFDGSAEIDGVYGVTGGAGADSLTGGAGGDSLTGGAGADSFIYTQVSQSSGLDGQFDLITDLDDSDHIDLSAIDANTQKAGDQAFHLVGHFKGHAGDLVLSYDAGTGVTTLAGDVNGDSQADFSIHIAGHHTGFTGVVL